jgi:hypothetical protein
METILNVPSELEYLESLVKLARKCKDEEIQQVIHIATILIVPTIKRANINKNHKGKLCI